MHEFASVLARPKFNLASGDIENAIRLLTWTAEVIDVKSNFQVVREDPDDDMILNVAIDGRAEFIVSGDDHLLKLASFRGIKIISVKEMLELLD